MKPLTRDNIISFYLPANGLISYAALSVNIMNPAIRSQLFGSSDVTNFLLWNSVAGAGAYFYTRKHLKKVPTQQKVAFAALGGSLFTFGSVLLWAWMKGLLPKNNGVLTVAGITSGFVIARLSHDYLENLDSQVD